MTGQSADMRSVQSPNKSSPNESRWDPAIPVEGVACSPGGRPGGSEGQPELSAGEVVNKWKKFLGPDHHILVSTERGSGVH